MNTETLLSLNGELSQNISDFCEVDTTTNITTNTSIISTGLKAYDHAEDDHFNEWYVYITEGNNAGVERRISDYATSTGTITVYGANLLAESGAITIRVGRYSYADKKRALNEAAKEISPTLYEELEDHTLIIGNWLPDGHLDYWSSSSALTFYTTSNITLARTATNGLKWGGRYSAKATASADNGYFYISSDTYPRLLDLQNGTTDFKCMAYPEVANDASIVIYTIEKDGTTTQTLTSTTTCAAGRWTQLKLESQAINDDLEEIQLRFKVGTNTKYVYFDDARVTGRSIAEFLLPDNFQESSINYAYYQTSGTSATTDMCDDLQPVYWDKIYVDDFIDSNGYRYIQIPEQFAQVVNRRIRLKGEKPLTELSADTDTITLENKRVPLLLAYAEYFLYALHEGTPSSEDVKRLATKSAKALVKYRDLKSRLGMGTSRSLKMWTY